MVRVDRVSETWEVSEESDWSKTWEALNSASARTHQISKQGFAGLMVVQEIVDGGPSPGIAHTILLRPK